MIEGALFAAKVHARTIYDSRGKPTVEVELCTEDGKVHTAAVPSGASTGAHEALELRDGHISEFLGQGVNNAVSNVNAIIGPALVMQRIKVTDQREIDAWLLKLDGTENKSRLGANAILGVSLAICRAGASAKGVPLYRHIADLAGTARISLPMPSFNIINGGSHAGNKMPFQEFMIMPLGARTFAEAMRIGSEIYQHLKIILKHRFGPGAVNIGDEGGFAPDIGSVNECLDLIVEAIEVAGYTGGVNIALDVAASEFFDGSLYNLDKKNADAPNPRIISGAQLADLYCELVKDYPIVSIEDGFDQDDFASWTHMCSSSEIQLVGDDLTVTNPARIQMAIDKRTCNALLLKVNQIGTLSESIDAARVARKAGWSVMVSHRSGETDDSFIADLAVGLDAGQIKSGAPCRSERLAKYNRLLRIEEELGEAAILNTSICVRQM